MPRRGSVFGRCLQAMRSFARRRIRRADLLARAIEPLEPRTLLSASLLKDINPSNSAVSTPAFMTEVNGVVYFNAPKLWRSDGSDAGTFELADAFYPTNLTNVNGKLFFAAQGGLWTSDGTAAGTAQVTNRVSSPDEFCVVGTRLFFRGDDGGGAELWSSDGTDAGTYRVKDINPGGNSSNPRGLTSSNGR